MINDVDRNDDDDQCENDDTMETTTTKRRRSKGKRKNDKKRTRPYTRHQVLRNTSLREGVMDRRTDGQALL